MISNPVSPIPHTAESAQSNSTSLSRTNRKPSASALPQDTVTLSPKPRQTPPATPSQPAPPTPKPFAADHTPVG